MEVFKRMKKDREKTIKELQAEGDAKAKQIRVEADAIAGKIMARADAYAKKLKAQGDAEAAKYYKVFEEYRTLSDFLKKRESILRLLAKGQTTVVLDAARIIPFDILKQAVEDKGKKAEGSGPGEISTTQPTGERKGRREAVVWELMSA